MHNDSRNTVGGASQTSIIHKSKTSMKTSTQRIIPSTWANIWSLNGTEGIYKVGKQKNETILVLCPGVGEDFSNMDPIKLGLTCNYF